MPVPYILPYCCIMNFMSELAYGDENAKIFHTRNNPGIWARAVFFFAAERAKPVQFRNGRSGSGKK